MKEIRAAARERMKGHCRVCPVCDGKACSGEVPGMGGLGTGASFRNNREALNACKLNMTALHDAREPRTNCTILGIDLSFPVMAAPHRRRLFQHERCHERRRLHLRHPGRQPRRRCHRLYR